jgi:hypothetical protein
VYGQWVKLIVIPVLPMTLWLGAEIDRKLLEFMENHGAGNEARTRDLNLGKIMSQHFQPYVLIHIY